MRTYTFTLTLSGVDTLTPQVSDARFEAGINGDENTLVYSRDGFVFVDFDCEAESLGDAVGSAVNQVVAAGYKVARVEVEQDAAAE
jgi:hypothetical protein